jgi:O-antigen/teichoic acid export membrane protein
MSNIKRNFFFSSFLTISNYIFPLLVFPYVSRVLGVQNIGIFNFVDSVINYYILLSMMGITILGIREIASVKRNPIDLNRSFSSLIGINLVSTFIAVIVLLISIYTIPKFYQYRELMWIGVLKLVFNCFLIEWFYKGLEEFKFITVRTIAVKLIYVLSVFVFVRSGDDLSVYFLLTVLMLVINAIINISYSRRYASFSLSNLIVKGYLKPFFSLGFYMVLTSMYTSFNVIYLGFVSGEVEVGYYTTATKLYAILLSFYTAFTGVMLPRMSVLIDEGKMEEFNEMISKSISGLLLFSLPLIVISVVFAPQIIEIIAGKGYEGAILPMRIVMPLLFVIGYEQILVIQILMPLKKDKVILRNSIVGAFVGVLMNILLVSNLLSIGSAIVWVLAELSILALSVYSVNKQVEILYSFKVILKDFVWSIPAIFGSCLISLYFNSSPLVVFFCGGSFIAVYFFIVFYFFNRNEIVVGVFDRIGKKIFDSASK